MYDIILTIHNKEELVERVLTAIKEFTTGVYTINVVLDGCTDKSEELVEKFFSQNDIDHRILHTPDVFETKANNHGIKNSNHEYIVIVQDDMVVNEMGWNERLAKPIKQFDDVFAVTAKTAHGLTLNQWSRDINNPITIDEARTRWCDILDYPDQANSTNTPRDILAIRDTVNRGPLLIRRDRMEKLNYFDEAFAPQNMDDHDLCCRAHKEFGWVAGCYWIDFINDPEWASTKTHDASRVPSWLYEAQQKNTRIIWNRHQDYILGEKHNENRKCE